MGYVEDLRKIVGNQALNLVGVAVAVINENGDLLLQRRNDGRWGIPGGFIEFYGRCRKKRSVRRNRA